MINNNIKIVVVFVLLVMLVGCALSTEMEAMVYKDEENKKLSFDDNLTYGISLGAINLANPDRVTDWVDANAFYTALNRSLDYHGLFASNGRYRLSATIESVVQNKSAASIKSTVTYTLKDSKSNVSLLNEETITSVYDGGLSDAINGFSRIRISHEKSLQNNIKRFMSLLSASVSLDENGDIRNDMVNGQEAIVYKDQRFVLDDIECNYEVTSGTKVLISQPDESSLLVKGFAGAYVNENNFNQFMGVLPDGVYSYSQLEMHVNDGSYLRWASSIGKKLMLSLSLESSGTTIANNSDEIADKLPRILFLSKRAVHKYSGPVKIVAYGLDKYMFNGDSVNPLLFACIDEQGYTYRGGTGKLTDLSSGKIVKFID